MILLPELAATQPIRQAKRPTPGFVDGEALPVFLFLYTPCHESHGPRPRTASVTRTTAETDITVRLDLDSTIYDVPHSGHGFDHMLDALARHGRLGLNVAATGTCTSSRTT